MALLEDAGLSLAQEQKNFYDYLHFSPIKVCIFYLNWCHIFDLVYCTYTTNILIPNGRCWFISSPGTKELLWLPIAYTSLLSRFVYFFGTDTVFDLVYCTYTTNILIPNGGCLFISGSGTKKLLWLPTLLSYQGLYYFWTDTVFGLVYCTNISILNGGSWFISGPGTKELLWLPTLLSYQDL